MPKTLGILRDIALYVALIMLAALAFAMVRDGSAETEQHEMIGAIGVALNRAAEADGFTVDRLRLAAEAAAPETVLLEDSAPDRGQTAVAVSADGTRAVLVSEARYHTLATWVLYDPQDPGNPVMITGTVPSGTTPGQVLADHSLINQ